jgi:hypothetical protein
MEVSSNDTCNINDINNTIFFSDLSNSDHFAPWHYLTAVQMVTLVNDNNSIVRSRREFFQRILDECVDDPRRRLRILNERLQPVGHGNSLYEPIDDENRELCRSFCSYSSLLKSVKLKNFNYVNCLHIFFQTCDILIRFLEIFPERLAKFSNSLILT